MKLSPGSLPLIFLMFVLLIAVSTVSVTAGPGDTVHNLNKTTSYSTIAAAIADADNYNMITVDSGTYVENLVINKSVILFGTGPTKPVINGQDNTGVDIKSSDVKILGFNITNCSTGILIRTSSNTIADCNISRCSYSGLSFMSGGSWSSVTNNSITFNRYGISLGETSRNTIVSNNISCNSGYGIYANYGTNNWVYQNLLMGNTIYAGALNYWNSTVTLTYQYKGVTYTNRTGNYWANYAGPDSNNDGIGDTPVGLNGGEYRNIFDYYPMIINFPVPPTAVFIQNATCGNSPFTVQFTDRSTGDPTSWHWEFGDGATSDVQNPTYTYTTPGTYLVNLTVTNALGSSTCKMESTRGRMMMVLRPLPSTLKVIWSNTYPASGGASASALDVARTSDNGFALVGYTPLSSGISRLIKADANGTKLWDQVYSDRSLNLGYSLLPETDGGITFAGANTLYNITITHTTADGSVVWSTVLPYSKGIAPGIAHTSDGGYIITGYQSFPWYSSRDRYWFSYDNVYIAKLSSGGALLWNNTFGEFTAPMSWGDPYHAMSSGLAVRETGSGYLVVGSLDIIGMGSDLYLAGTDSAGNMLWNKTWGIPGYGEAGCTLLPTDDGNYLIAGNSWIPGATDAEKQCNVMLMKVSAGGDILWTQNYTGYGYRSAGETVIPDGNGGYVIAGYTQTPDRINRPYLVGVDSNGAQQWEAVLPFSLYEHLGIAATGDGGFVVGGGDGTMMSGNSNAFMIKLGTETVRPTIQFSSPSATGNEGATVHINLFRSGDTSLESSVLVSDIGGTAVRGKNFTFTPVRITFEAGNAYSGFDVALPSNNVIEPRDTYVNFSLSSPVNGNIGNQQRFNLTIHDTTPPVSTELQWVRLYPLNGFSSTSGYGLIGTADGGYALAGDVTEMWYTKPLLLKTDASGVLSWNKTYNIGSSCEVLQESDGGYVFTGRDYNGMLTVTRTYPNGSVMWTYGTTDVIAARSSIAPAADGYFVSGAKSMDHPVVNAYVIKLNREGTRVWDQTTGGGSVNLGWSTYYIKSAAYSVWPTSDGGCVLAGYIDPLGMADDLFMSKISSTGGVEWSGKFGLDGNYDGAFGVLQASDGGYVAAGFKTEDSGSDDVRKVWLLKTYGNGTGQWDRVFNGSDCWSQADSLITTDDGGYLLAGQIQNESGISRPYLIKVNTSGIKEWETALNLSITGRLSILPAGGNDYVIGGTTRNPDTGITEAFIAKLTVRTTAPASPRIGFSASAATANEGTTAHVMLTRTGDATNACSVNVAVTGGTASSSDYTMASTTATFAAGVSSQSIAIDLAADHTMEGPETLVLGLSSPSGATLGTPSTFTLTINDTSRTLDGTPPVTSCVLTGTAGLGNWYTSSVTVDLDATDAGGNGVARISYKLDSAAWVTTTGSSASFTISANGIHTLLYNSTDLDDNHEAARTRKITVNKLLYPVSVLPRDEATDVSLYPQVRVTFNALIGLAPVTITLEDQAHRRVSGVVSRSGKVLTFTPRDPLAALTTYTATVSSTDEAVPVAYAWSFTTMAPDNASIIAISGPDPLVIDEEHLQPFTLAVTVRNTGLDTWKTGDRLVFFNAFRSGDYWNYGNGTPNYPDQFYGWTFQLTSGPSSPVGPGQDATYTFAVTPTTEVYGNLSIGLWMRATNGNYFGDMAIYHPMVSRPALGATILKIEGPEEMYYNPDPDHLYSDPDYDPSYLLNLTVKNTGETNWPLGYNLAFYDPFQDPSEVNSYLSRPQSPDRFMDWTFVQTSAPSGLVRPGDNVTYTYRVYPESPRRSNWKIGFWMSDSYGYCFGNKSYWASRLYAGMNNAQVASVTCPPQMLAGREYQITVRMENTGQMPWIPGYELICFDPAAASPWESTFSQSFFKDWIVEPIAAPAGKVNPGGTGTYTFVVVPSTKVIGKVELGFVMSDLINNNFGEVAGAYPLINGSRSAPLITAVSPANGSAGADPRTTIEVTFDRVMDTESLRSAFRVVDDTDTRLKGDISYDGRTATFTPADRLEFSHAYRVIINGVRDRNGYLAPGPYAWQFNTTDRNAVVQFHTASAFAEFGDIIHIVVDRTGDTAGTTSCVVSTQFAYSGFTFNPGLPATLTFGPGETSKTIDFSTAAEFPTTIATQSYVTLSDVSGGRLGTQQRFNLTVPRTLISLVSDDVAPGQTGYIKVRRTGDVSGTSSCTLTPGTGTTAEAYRYVSLMPVTVTFSPGETEKEVAVINAIDRASTSSDYYLPIIQVNASGAVGATVLGAPYNSAHLTLLEKDMGTHFGFPGSSAITVNEGSELLVTLQRRNCNVSYYDSCNVYIIDQTTYPNDYQANVPAQFRFEPGQTELPIVVHVGPDGDSEGMEYIVLGIREEPSARYKINIVDTSASSRLQINGPAEGWEGETIPVLITKSLGYNVQSSCVLSVVGGSASSPEDYTMPVPAIVTFPAGTAGNEPSRRQTVNIALVHDGLATGDRTIVFKLTDIVNGMAIGGPYTFTIRDTDVCHIGFNTTGMDVGEGDVVRLNLTREGGDLSQPSSCVLSFKEGTASPADYSSSVPLPATITFGPGEQTKFVDITLLADHVTEGVEFATFNLSGFNTAVPNKDEIKLEIRDRSVYPTHIYFYETTPLIYETYLSVENGGRFMWEGETAHIRLIRTGDVSGTSSCVVSNVGGTAETREYQATLPTTITFGPGETVKTVDVTVLHTSYKNGISALSNYITLGLSNPVNTDLPIDEYTGRILNESYYLVDTDSRPYIGFSGTNITTNEGSTVNLKVKLHYLGTNTYYTDFGLSKYSPSTADASDYTIGNSLEFAPGSTEVTVPVAIVADHVAEGDESLLLRIGSNSLETMFDNGYRIDIWDTSSDGTMPAVTQVAPTNGAIDVSPSAAVISATFNKYIDRATLPGFILRDSMNRRVAGTVSYSDSTRTAVFTPNQSLASGASYTAYLTGIRDLDDNILATYTWKFTTVQAPTPVILPAVVSATPADGASDVPLRTGVTITFNKTIVRASFQLYDSQELVVGGTTAIVGKVLTFTTDGPLDLEAEYHGIVKDAVDTDGYHMSGNYSFAFTTGALPIIAFTASAATASEGTTPHVMLYRSGDTSLEASVLVTDIGGTAVRGKNYTFTPVRITFEADQAYAGFDVGLPSNGVSEPVDTYVNFSLSGPVNATLGDLAKFNLTVHDATRPAVVSTAPLNQTTGSTAGTIPAVTFSKPIASVTFQLKDSSNSVVSGTDLVDGANYTYTPSTPLKYGERYWATVLNATDDGGRHLATPYEFTFVTGPAPVISLSASSAAVNEGSTYQLKVLRTGDLTGLSTCFVDGGYDPSSIADYSTDPWLPKSFTFGAGEAQKTINFTAYADSLTEGPESSSFGISYVTGATRGTPYSFTLSISDTSVTPKTISFTKAGSTAFAGTTLSITVKRAGTSQPSSAAIQVGGTAVEGTDFTVSPKQVDFTYMDYAEISVTVSGTVTGLDKYVNFSLTSLNGVDFSNQQTYNLSLAGAAYIPVIQFATASGRVEEGGSQVVTLTRTGLLNVESQVQVSATGTADGSDYTSYPSFGSFLTLYSGESSRNITIYGTSDYRTEGTETLGLSLIARGNSVIGPQSTYTLTINDTTTNNTKPIRNLRTWNLYTNLTKAISEAARGDRIEIDSGTYTVEALDINGTFLVGRDTGRGRPLIITSAQSDLKDGGIDGVDFDRSDVSTVYADSVLMVDGSSASIKNCNIVSSATCIYHWGYLEDDDLRLTIENCNLVGGGRTSINYDIMGQGTGSTTIRNCTVSGAGIRFSWAHNLLIDRCVLSGVNLTLSGTDGNTIRDSRVTGGEIQLLSTYTTVISNVTALYSPSSGLLVDGGWNLMATGLAVYDSATGVRLVDLYHNATITDSLIARADGDGLRLENSEDVTVINTSVIDCATGVRLLPGSGNNTFCLNRFSSVVNALQTDTSNKWNTNGPLAYHYGGRAYTGNLGNQWNNYPGVDANGDGIGDTPFLSGTIRDNYPLVSRSALTFQDNGPTVMSVSWGFNGQDNFRVSDSIRVDLDRDIDGSALDGVSIRDSSNRLVPCDISYRKYFYGNDWSYYLYFEPQSDLAYGQTYTLTVSSLVDVSGHRMVTPWVVTFTTETNTFQVLKVYPQDGASGKPSGWGEFVYNPIVVTFNRLLEDISTDDITAGRISLLDESRAPVEITAYGSNSAFLDIRPKWNLKNATVYTIRINGIRDDKGNVMPGTFESRFVTWGNPEMVATLPGDRATDVPVNQPVFVYFDKPLNLGTLNGITIKDSYGNTVPTSVGYVPAGSGKADGSVSTVIIGHNDFSYSADYTIEVTGVADMIGNYMKYTDRKTFRTTDRPYIGSVSPAGAAIDVPRAATITATFSKDMDPTSIQSGFTFRDASGNNLAGTVSYDSATRTATFRPAALLGYGTMYSAHVAGARDLAGNSIQAYSWGFTTIRAPISILSVTPASGAMDQPTTTVITATFSDDMDDWTVTDGFLVKEFNGGNVQGTVTYDAATRKATFRPTGELNANGNMYTVTLSGMVGTHSGPMPDYSWNFRTLWRKPTVVSTAPAYGATGVSPNATITVTFSEGMDPESVRLGFKLRDYMNNGVAGSVVTNGNTVTFTPSAPLNGGEHYTVYLLGLKGLQKNTMPDYAFAFTVIHKIEAIPTDGLEGTPRPSLIPTATPRPPFQTTLNGMGVTINGDRITAPAGTDISRFLTDGQVSIPAGHGSLTVDVDVGSPRNTGTITGVHVDDQSSGTANGGTATVAVTADLDGLPSGRVSISATVSDPTPDDIRAAREWIGGRSRSLVNALALIDVQKSGFTNDDIVDGTAKITLTVKKPVGFSRTKTYTVIRHGDDGYEELTATYKSETMDTVTFEILSPNGFSTFLLAETADATPTPVPTTMTPPPSATPVPGPGFLLIGLAVLAGVMIMVRVRKT